MNAIRFKHLAKEFLADADNVRLIDSTPLVAIHLACIGLFFVGVSPIAVAACVALYFLRVFAITAGYHRYFSHNSFKTSRIFQFVLAFIGASAAQLGPLWWASHHRNHHNNSDTEKDVHSPVTRGMFWSHVGWLLCCKHLGGNYSGVQDLSRYPELRFIDRYHIIAPVSLAIGLFATGAWLAAHHPALHTSGWQLLMWGFFLSTVFVYHATFCINSLTHIIGTQRFDTNDASRNHLALALITMGEGWHNNHHHYPRSTRQGLYWWEIDLSFYILKVLSLLGIVRDLHTHPARVYAEAAELKRLRSEK
jgi:stearoyl-CoA desaturase (delta-9 desaturase)